MKFSTFPENTNLFQKKGIVKFGIDPSGTSLHLGHLLPLRIVKLLKNDGCDIHIVLGTFTSTIGDATGRDSTRPMLEKEVVLENTSCILPQIKRILGDDITIHFNNEWFDKMTLVDIMSILSKFTVQDLLNRDSFQNRIQNGSGISMQELVYPLLQGIDSVVLKSNFEIGGQDQLLNMIKGRELQTINGIEPQVCIMTPVINGLDGRKMSKSFNNTINLNDSPEDVFGKCMSISDETMNEWLPIFFDKIEIKHPMEQKKELAFQITTEIWNEELAEMAKIHFESVIQSKQIPEDMIELSVGNLVEIVSKIIKGSKSDARRLLKSNAVKVNGEKVTEEFEIKTGDIIKVGKRNFAKII